MSDQKKSFGKYQLINQINEGGFGSVYQAYDLEKDQTVALKRLHAEFQTDNVVVSLFRQEIEMMQRLDHPHIAPLLDFGEVEGVPFITMPLIEGPTLADLIASHHPQVAENLSRWFQQICEVLEYLHHCGIVHCDLKPANILIGKEGPILIDFGLAYQLNQPQESHGNIFSGSPEYTAPELWQGERSGPQIDIYALGCILYEMATGSVLFQRPTLIESLNAHFLPTDLFYHSSRQLGYDLESILYIALEKSPADRFESVSKLRKAFNVFRRANISLEMTY